MSAQGSILCHWLFDAQGLYLRSVVLASNLPHRKRPGRSKRVHLLNGRHRLIHWRTCNRVSWWQITIASALFEPSAFLELGCYVLFSLLPLQHCMVILHRYVLGRNNDWRALQYHRSSHYHRYWKTDQINWRKYCRYFCPDWRHCSRLCSRLSSSYCSIKWNLYVLHIFWRMHNCSSSAFPTVPDVMENIQRERK